MARAGVCALAGFVYACYGMVVAPEMAGFQFGTELIVGAEGSIAGLLGASPGASTAVAAMLDLLRRAFPGQAAAWAPKLTEAIPSYGHQLADEPDLLREVRAETTKTLELTGPVELAAAR